jgi:ABC-type dipeptide/oligopeptide/nickel transport system permease component
VHFIVKRIAVTILTLILVTALAFISFNIIPGDSATLIGGTEATEEQLTALRRQMGLNRSLPVQYFSWLEGFLSGRLGNSVRYEGQSISGLIAARLPVTFSLAGITLIFILVISFPLSLLTSKREGSVLDHVMNAFVTVDMSMPHFFLGILLIWVLGLILHVFSPGSYVDYHRDFTGFCFYLIFPALSIASPNSAQVIKFLRSSIFIQMKTPYARTARARGATGGIVLRRHILKNAVIPVITLLGMLAADIFSGSIVIEQVFTIPGMGRLLISSITSRDYQLAQSLVVCIACIVVVANSAADIIIQLIDPRIRLERSRQ